jgi:hypothetical protein
LEGHRPAVGDQHELGLGFRGHRGRSASSLAGSGG